MSFGTVAITLLCLWFAYLGIRTHIKRRRQQCLPPGITQDSSHRALSSDTYDAATQALRAFATEYRNTFLHGGCSKASLATLHTLRNDALQRMYDLRLRLPNDLDAEMEMTQHIEETDTLLKAYISDVQTRCGLSLLFPGPLDDTYYRQFYRAHNDVVA